MKAPEAQKRNNEKYYPLVFFILFPLAGGSAAMEYGIFDGDIATGAFWALAIGCLLYAAWRLKQKRRAQAQ